jgi:predicted PurR-regulated permease PerM
MADDETTMTRNLETAVRIGALFVVLFWVVQIVAPFIPVIVWAIIIAVASYPAYRWMLDKFDGRAGLAATTFTLLALVIVIVPATWLGQASVEWGTTIAEKISEGTLEVPPPPAKVATWPFIGEKVHNFWSLASTNLSAAAGQAEVQLKAIGVWLLKVVAGVGIGILQFTFSIIIAGVLLAKAEGAAAFARQLFARLYSSNSRTDFAKLSEQTIRSVAAGVIGVAFIQAALIGIALIVIQVPGAPIWIVVCILLGIVQLPATLVTLPIIIWVWGSHDTFAAALFTAYIVPAGLADNVLKPILLGRGVEAPMLVIFVGAIGGFVLSGIIGLFIGAVIVVLAYELFQAWLGEGSEPADTAGPAVESARE